MPIQAPQWTDYLNCPACCREFAPSRSPVSLGCGHTLCRLCLKNLHRKQCPFDQTVISVDLEELVVNSALLQLAGYPPAVQPYHPPCIQRLSEQDRHAYDMVVKNLEHLAVFLKYCGNGNNGTGSRLSRPMQRKLVTLLQCAMTDAEGRGKAARAARSLGDRTVTELIVQHQNPQQLSANLWAAVRSRGCQFLGPAMQEEVLKLVLLALEDGSALSRKVLVMFVVQRLEPHFPQASKTSIGHVVQLLYRASCFKVSKRVCDSSLMQLKEEFRTYESLRREHDAQIVQIATEAGLRIAPDQWSALLYGDTQHKSHMQSIIDKLQTPQSFAQSVQELFITLQRTGDPAQLIAMSIPLDRLANIDASPDAQNPTWQQLSAITTALKEVVSGLVHFMQHHASTRDNNHNTQKVMERQPEPPSQPANMQGIPGRYKVSMCRDAQTRTYCPRGNNCTYAHSEEELERYRRINMAASNQYVMQPVVAISRPIYHRYTMPPPMPMEHAYNMPHMQQQISPSAHRAMVGVEAMDREQPYEHEHAREQPYEHQRERSYEHREQPYEMTREQSYERIREQSYDITREQYDISQEQYDITQEQQYDVSREKQYDIREQPYDINQDIYDITREKSFERAREAHYDHPQPNVATDNYAGSYANALMHGADTMARATANQNIKQNGNVNTMMPPPGRYYPRYVGHATYPYMPPIDTGRMKSEEMPQYQGMGAPVRPVPAHEYPGMEYQQSYTDENGSELHFDTLSFGIAVPVPVAVRPMPMPHAPPESAWTSKKPVKSPQMFKFDEKAKNLPIGMEIGKSIPIGIEMPKNVPIGRDVGNPMKLGMDMSQNMPIAMDIKNVPIGTEMPKNLPIGMEFNKIKNIPIGMEINKIAMDLQNVPIGIDTPKNGPLSTIELAKNLPIGNMDLKNVPIGAMDLKNVPIGCTDLMNVPIGGTDVKNVPIGKDVKNLPIGKDVKNVPIVKDVKGNKPIAMEMAGNKPIGMEMATNMPIGKPQTNGDMIHHGMGKPKVRTVNEKRDDQELEKELKALERRISTEFSKPAEPEVKNTIGAALQ